MRNKRLNPSSQVKQVEEIDNSLEMLRANYRDTVEALLSAYLNAERDTLMMLQNPHRELLSVLGSISMAYEQADSQLQTERKTAWQHSPEFKEVMKDKPDEFAAIMAGYDNESNG